MKYLPKLTAMALSVAMAASLAACSSSDPSASPAQSTGGDTGTQGGQDSYTIGVCQQMQHEALDAATQGFQDALKEKLGDQVEIKV